jgi:hypothetical protein
LRLAYPNPTSQRNPSVSHQTIIIITMARILFFLALLVAAASAFVSPANHAGKLKST